MTTQPNNQKLLLRAFNKMKKQFSGIEYSKKCAEYGAKDSAGFKKQRTNFLNKHAKRIGGINSKTWVKNGIKQLALPFKAQPTPVKKQLVQNEILQAVNTLRKYGFKVTLSK